jgi:hydrogenase maturation protein HypF
MTPGLEARDIVITGRVQGVGFRPFVYRLAHELILTGTVLNGSGKVFVHAEGPRDHLDRLERKLLEDAPPLARPVLASSRTASLEGLADFSILPSEASEQPEIHVPPDLFTCDDCVAELSGPAERRHQYPFINCTQCGPRYTIIEAMPYDRPNTSMRDFPLCADCLAEYSSPLDRRFHAQPLACPVCGPQLQFREGEKTEEREQALTNALVLLDTGGILAVKGVGGYHLMCDATDAKAVARLRERKYRPHKPLAVMFPLSGADGLDAVRAYLEPGRAEATALVDPARPIVLIRQKENHPLAENLAPGLRELGAFLPYSPLHHLLLSRFGRPVVATSGNISGEPVITVNFEAEQRLGDIANAFLHHNRPIVRPADDPVLRVISGHARPLRLGRGTAPLEIDLPFQLDRPMLATGGHMKNTVALAWDSRIVVSPHIGELDAPRTRDVFAQVIADLQGLYDVQAECLVTDLHPGYAGSRWAKGQSLPVIAVQHHAAHAAGLAAEHPDVDRWLIFTWDGVGLGSDGTLWGGEALAGQPGEWQRRAGFRPFQLTGGDAAGREPWRSAAALQWETGTDWLPSVAGADLARESWRKSIHTHETTAAGRLFDAASCLVLGRETASFEGQGPMELEQASASGVEAPGLPLEFDAQGLLRADWVPLLPLLTDTTVSVPQRALCEQASSMLEAAGFDVRLHSQVPANDGGLSFGQVVEACGQHRTPG